MFLFKSKKPCVTAYNITSIANLINIKPYFTRNIKTVDYEYNDFRLTPLQPMKYDEETIPRILSVFLKDKCKTNESGKLHVRLDRSKLIDDGVNDQKHIIVKPDMSIAILHVDSYNIISRVYEISCIQERLAIELNSGVMIIVDNPDEDTTIKFPRLRPEEDESDLLNAYDDTIIIEYFKKQSNII